MRSVIGRAALGFALIGSAGCGDRLAVGYQGTLVPRSGSGDTVHVEGLSEHLCPSSGLRNYNEMAGTKCEAEFVAAGSKVSVVEDGPGSEADRKVKVKLLEAPFAGITGKVSRLEIR